MLSVGNIFNFKSEFLKNENLGKEFKMEQINSSKEPDLSESRIQEMDKFIIWSQTNSSLYYNLNTRTEDWVKQHFGSLYDSVTNNSVEKFFMRLSECTSKMEIQELKISMLKYQLFFGIFSEYICNSTLKYTNSPIKDYHFIYYSGDLLIKRIVFSDETNVKRLFEINRFLGRKGFLFSVLSLDDFLMTFFGIALKRYRHIEYMEFVKMKNFLRCQKCHVTTELTLNNFINSSQNTVEAYYKCPRCGEVYSFSKLKKIYEENMRNAY